MYNIEEFVYPTQAGRVKKLRRMFHGQKRYYCMGNFLLVKGTAPVMLISHLDTVHAEPVKVICKSEDGNIIMSPQGIGGDDRCGVYGICKAHELAKVKPYLLFTCDEEIGGIGAECFATVHSEGKFPAELDDIKFIVELDRKGKNDAVYYNCANTEFEDFILDFGFSTARGSFSDISVIAPELGVAAVNLSSGYYNAHTQHEYIVISELENTINRVVKIVEAAASDSCPRFEYVKRKYKLSSSYYQHLLTCKDYMIPDEEKWLYSK